jgi:CheY-like chemotaxis protein
MQDVSRSGAFLAVSASVDAGAPVVIALTLDGDRVTCPATVVHCLVESDARTLCRSPGIGIVFCDPPEPAFAIAIERLVRRARLKHPESFHVVVADPQLRFLERLSTSLDAAGFTVATAATGLELWGACMRRTPDVVVIERNMPMVDGLELIERLACDDRLVDVPVLLMTRDAAEIGPALQRGASDVILKPFTMLELIARARRLAQTPRRTERVSLSGSLADIGLAPLLMMLEQQRKTGRIVLSNGDAAWIDVIDGRIADAGWSRGSAHPRAIVMELLDWERGTFKLVTSPPRHPENGAELALPITHLLLEQARLRDEASRRPLARA